MAVVLSARELTRHYEVSRGLFKGHALVRALNGVSFELEAGKTLAVVGESGCGKSTLARSVTMIEPPSSGKLLYDGRDNTGALVACVTLGQGVAASQWLAPGGISLTEGLFLEFVDGGGTLSTAIEGAVYLGAAE